MFSTFLLSFLSVASSELWTPPDSGSWLPRSRFLPKPALDDLSADCSPVASASGFLTLKEALSEQQAEDRSGKILIALNGASRGALVEFKLGCLYSAAYAAAKALATPVELQVESDGGTVFAPLFLYNMQGLPVHQEKDLELGSPVRVAFLVLPDEVFVWPGVDTGYRWNASGLSLETKSISPKVILVHNMLSSEYTKGAIDQGGSRLVASPETTLIAGKRTRTSSSAGLGVRTPTAKHIHAAVQQAARLPYHNLAEQPMLLHYIRGQLYKNHYDFYHFFLDELPRERVRPAQAAKNYVHWMEYINVQLLENKDLSDIVKQRAPELVPPKYYDFDGESTRVFETALAALCFKYWDSMFIREDAESWKKWMESNLSRGAKGIFSALIGFLPEALAVGQEAWEATVLDVLNGAPGLSSSRQLELENLVRIPDHLRGASTVLLSTKSDGSGYRCAASPRNVNEILPWEGRVPANRFATILFYLNDVFSGGHTVFPMGSTAPGDSDGLTELEERTYRANASECIGGVGVRPARGAAALFYSLTGAGERDYMAQHTGCPPVDPPGLEEPQQKWAINGFVWNIPMVPEFCPGRSKMCWDKEG